MTSKERISTRDDSRDKKKITPKFETNMKMFQIFYDQEKLMNIEIQSTKTVQDLNHLLKQKLKNRFYNYLGLQSVSQNQVLDYALMTKNYSLSHISQYQKFRILLEGEVHDLHIPTINDFTFLKLLGKGASSVVYLVRHKQNCKLYALKQVDKTYITDFKKMQFLLREKKILTQIVNKSSFFSKIYATFQSKDHLNFLLKYYPGGQLFYHLQIRKFKQTQARLYFCQILLAIESLHKEKIIFRDLKPQNILIDLNGNAVLSDFGLCKTNVRKQELTTSFCGSDVYMPPQMKEKLGYNYHVDFYTLGAFLFEMITGLPPFYDSKTLDFPQSLSKQVIDLCQKLLQNDLNKRIYDFKKIKEHEWLKNIDWHMIKTKQYEMPIKLYPNKSYIHEDFRQPIRFKQINEQIFDRLFDFFFWMSDNQHGISHCYVQKNSKQMILPEKNLQKKQKSKSKNHRDSVNKLNKMFSPFAQKIKKSQNNLKKEKSSLKKQSSKEKSLKKRSAQNSPYLHKIKNEKSLKKQTLNKTDQRLSSKDSQRQLNIYQKNIRQVKKVDTKTIKNASSFNGRSYDSIQKDSKIQSPLTFTKRRQL